MRVARGAAERPRSPRTRAQTFDFDVLDELEKREQQEGAAFDFEPLGQLEPSEKWPRDNRQDAMLSGTWAVEGRSPSVYDIVKAEDGQLFFRQAMGRDMLLIQGALRERPPWLQAELVCAGKPAGSVRVRYLDGTRRLLSNFSTNGCSLEWGVDAYAVRMPRPFPVDNRQLRAQTRGLGYHERKCLDSKGPDSSVAAWGSIVLGLDEGDGWLQVSAQYLPMEVNGATVLSRTDIPYCCQPPSGRPQPICSEPKLNGVKTGKLMPAGTVFRVSLELQGADGILHLRLANGEGWLPARDPNFGTVCVRQAAAPCDAPPTSACVSGRTSPNGHGVAMIASPRPVPEAEAYAVLARLYNADAAQPFDEDAPLQGDAAAESEEPEAAAPQEPARPPPDFFPFRDDGAVGEVGWERDNVCRAVSLLYCEWVLGRTPAPRSFGGKRFINETMHQVDPLPTAAHFYTGVFRPFYADDGLPRRKGPDTPWLKRVYEATDPDCVCEEFLQTVDLPAIKIRQVFDQPKAQAWHAYFQAKGTLGAELLSGQRSGVFCLSYFQLSVQGSDSGSVDGRAHCIAVITKSLPDQHFYICDPDVGVYRFDSREDLLHFLRVPFKQKATRASSGGTTGVSRLRLVEVVPAFWKTMRMGGGA